MDDRERAEIRASIPADRKFLKTWKELEAWTGISEQTLRKLKEFGLPGSYFEGTLFFSKEAVNKFFDKKSYGRLDQAEKMAKSEKN